MSRRNPDRTTLRISLLILCVLCFLGFQESACRMTQGHTNKKTVAFRLHARCETIVSTFCLLQAVPCHNVRVSFLLSRFRAKTRVHFLSIVHTLNGYQLSVVPATPSVWHNHRSYLAPRPSLPSQYTGRLLYTTWQSVTPCFVGVEEHLLRANLFFAQRQFRQDLLARALEFCCCCCCWWWWWS